MTGIPRLSDHPVSSRGASPTRAITFALPGDHRSGGVRVTVIMANLLLARGYAVRIACRRPARSLTASARRLLRSLRTRKTGAAGWLHEFKGNVAYYDSLDQLDYAAEEVVIAVGTYMVDDVRRMTKPVVKVRFHHGFPAKPTPLQAQAWTGRMPTITVSQTLVPKLNELTGGAVWGVVPNGIDTRDYFFDPAISRLGIGALFNPHPNKAPEDLMAVLQLAQARWPDTPQFVFGTEAQPRPLGHVRYTRYPPVAQARAIYNSARVWLLTSLTEGLPGVVLEAMACGCVVISSDNDGSLEIVRHEDNGLIVPRRDRAGFVEAIGRLLGDEALRERLSLRARETVRAFTWERAADRMEAFLAEAPVLARRL